MFFDVDGTLSEYRYEDKLYGGKCPELGCSTMLKPEVILECCKHFNIKKEDVAFVDDRLDVLREAEELGILLYHPSSFVE